ncbi:MAG: hypothetical protein SPH77_06325, partial [Campylobacter sp.]|uniref:hypothetical protein n=1 Tax=Campylobacter sp. TaxID=205 RepID=UPI002A9111ED
IASVALLPRNDTGLGILELCCPLGFAVAAEKKLTAPQGSQPIKANKNLGNSRIPRDCFGRFAPSQ